MNNPEISICIPTYNRATTLDKTLAHLANIKSIKIEIIVSDNASADNTHEVVAKYKTSFCRLYYHRQSHNIGAVLNIQSALNLATSELCYFLSDDDRIVSQAFRKIIDMFHNNPQLSAVYGNHCEFDPYNGNEGNICMTIQTNRVFSYQDRITLFEQVPLIWCPIVKTEVYQRHCYYDKTSFGFWRLVSMLLKHGSIALITDMIYKHAQTTPRAEFKMVEPWFHDMHSSDFELFIAELDPDHNIDGTTVNVMRIVHERSVSTYVTAVRFALEQKKYIWMRHYLLRARCHNLISKEELAAWEQRYMLHWALERIETLLMGLPNIKKIIMENSILSDYILQLHQQERFSSLPEIEVSTTEGVAHRSPSNHEMILAYDYATLQRRETRTPAQEISLIDLINTLRVSTGNLNIQPEL